MATWKCIEGCGACCHLEPRDRPDLADYLTAEQLAHYLTLVGEDGWCIHYDATMRRCKIYESRPDFCRVQPETFGQMFGITPDELNDFAIACCEQQIEGVYGNRSEELEKFIATVDHPSKEG